jgi:ketosteroid isomerase-like protein
MSSDSVEVVRVALEAAGRGDWEAFMRALAPGVVWTPVRGDPEFAVYRGIEAVRAWGNMWRESFPDLRWEAQRIIDASDDRVVAIVRLHGRGGASGARVEHTYGTVFSVQADRIVGVHEHRTVRRALEAAGLSSDSADEQESQEARHLGSHPVKSGDDERR